MTNSAPTPLHEVLQDEGSELRCPGEPEPQRHPCLGRGNPLIPGPSLTRHATLGLPSGAVLPQDAPPLLRRGTIHDEHAVEMINLVLHDPGQEISSLKGEWATFQVTSLHHHTRRPGTSTENPGTDRHPSSRAAAPRKTPR